MDSVESDEPERVLDYRPLVLYFKFAEATWRIRGALELGVYPLKSVTRDWDPNAARDVKVKRRGFTLIPDFAGTAFMMQGVTVRSLRC